MSTEMLSNWRRRLTQLAVVFAGIGGLFLVAAALFTVYAVVGASLGFPVLGDSEIVELAAGIAVASFMPLCQMKGGHVSITVFTDWTPPRLRQALEIFASLLAVLIIAILTWRFLVGGISAFDRNRASMFLQLPTWWGYAAATLPMLLWTVSAVFCLIERVFRAPSPTPSAEIDL